MKITKRNCFLNRLIDLGFDIDSTEHTIEAYFKNEFVFLISDLSRYQMEITGNLKHLGDENINVPDLYDEILRYAGLEIEDRFKDREIIRSEND